MCRPSLSSRHKRKQAFPVTTLSGYPNYLKPGLIIEHKPGNAVDRVPSNVPSVTKLKDIVESDGKYRTFMPVEVQSMRI